MCADSSLIWFDKQGKCLYSCGVFESHATVAQPVEQGPLKPKVLGSIPSRRTIKTSPHGDVLFLVFTHA